MALSFPVSLSGKPIVIEKNWCRQCDKGDYAVIDTVRASGGKKQPYCIKCWQAFMPMLQAHERGEAPLPAIRTTASSSWDFVVCKNPGCAEKNRKAKHYSGWCTYSCAVGNGWEEAIAATPPPAPAQGEACVPPLTEDLDKDVGEDKALDETCMQNITKDKVIARIAESQMMKSYIKSNKGKVVDLS